MRFMGTKSEPQGNAWFPSRGEQLISNTYADQQLHCMYGYLQSTLLVAHTYHVPEDHNTLRNGASTVKHGNPPLRTDVRRSQYHEHFGCAGSSLPMLMTAVGVTTQQ